LDYSVTSEKPLESPLESRDTQLMTDRLSLQDSFSHDGFWWLPHRPEERVSGTLRFSASEGASLRLVGSFGGIEAFNLGKEERVTVHGVNEKGKRITLLDAFVKSRSINWPGIMIEQYRVYQVCIGYHLETEDDAIFDKSFIRFDGLEEWLAVEPFKESWEFEPNKLNLSVEAGQSEDIAKVGDYTVGKSSSMSTEKSTRTEHAIKVQSFLYCETGEPLPIREHFQIATRLQELASLCTGHFLPLTHLSLRLHDPERNGRPSAFVEIVAQMKHSVAGSRPKNEHPLFSILELLSANDRAVENWFKQYETLSPAINLFFAVTGEEDMYTSVRFLLAVQALEVFHRRTTKGALMSKTEFGKLRTRLVDAIPSDVSPDMIEKLKGLYNFANEPSLMQRLETILAVVNDDFGESVPGFGERFARKVVNTRNYNTHFTASLEAKALDDAELWWASRRIVLLLTYLFLKNIGITAPSFRNALERHNEFQKLFNSPELPF
jgi:ApeA N-terminal domain 1